MQDTEDLMQLAADGAATADELAALERALVASPKLRPRYEATRALVQKLDSVPMVEPPPMQILSMLHRRMKPQRSGRKWFAIAYAAAAVLIIAIAVQHAIVPPEKTSATMAPVESVIGRASNRDATVVVRSRGDELDVEVTAKSTYSIDFDHNVLQQSEPGRFQRLPGAKGRTVIRLRLPNNNELSVPVDLP